ncbi:MAG: hypothetical protein AAGL18_14665, partial [Pseudomonadota bacterium]
MIIITAKHAFLRHCFLALALIGFSLPVTGFSVAQTDADTLTASPPITLVIHGGAGALAPGRYTPEQEAAFKTKLNEALDAG